MPSAFNPCARHSPPVPAPTIITLTRLPTVAASMPTSCLLSGGESFMIRYRPVNGLSGRKGPLIWSNDSVKSVEPIRRRGRPRDLDKLQGILDAASALFLERGIAGTTMESVAERACVSKMTVYGHFRDKPALLSAVFERNIKAIRLPDLVVGPDPTSSLAQLAEFGERLVWFLTRPEIVRTAWVMAGVRRRKPTSRGGVLRRGSRHHAEEGCRLPKVAGRARGLADRRSGARGRAAYRLVARFEPAASEPRCGRSALGGRDRAARTLRDRHHAAHLVVGFSGCRQNGGSAQEKAQVAEGDHDVTRRYSPIQPRRTIRSFLGERSEAGLPRSSHALHGPATGSARNPACPRAGRVLCPGCEDQKDFNHRLQRRGLFGTEPIPRLFRYQHNREKGCGWLGHLVRRLRWRNSQLPA